MTIQIRLVVWREILMHLARYVEGESFKWFVQMCKQYDLWYDNNRRVRRLLV